MFNQIIIDGHVGGQPEKKGNAEGAPVRFSVAVNMGRDSGGGNERDAEWFRVKTFGRSRDFLLENVGKGDRVLVIGRLESHTYEGTKYWEIISQTVQLLNRKERAPQPQVQPQAPAQGGWAQPQQSGWAQPQAPAQGGWAQPQPQAPPAPAQQTTGGGWQQAPAANQHTVKHVPQQRGDNNDPIPF